VGFGAQTPCPPAPAELESAVDRCGLGGERLAIDGDGRVLLDDGTPARVRRIEPTLDRSPRREGDPVRGRSEVWSSTPPGATCDDRRADGSDAARVRLRRGGSSCA
jgi:hypothetical protein